MLPLSAEALPLGRQATLFHVVRSLTQSLRSVFVPFYRYLLDSAVAHLGGSEAAGAVGGKEDKRSRKRRKLLAAAGAAVEGSTDAWVVQTGWRLRLEVS